MKQLKIIEEFKNDEDITKHISNLIILNSDDIEDSITIYFYLIDKDKLKFTLEYNAEDFLYENTYSFIDANIMLNEIIVKLKELFNLIDITISENDFSKTSTLLLRLINGCKKMKGQHPLDSDNGEASDAYFTILAEEGSCFNDKEYYCIEILNHGWEKENHNDWMFNKEHHNPNEIMDAYAEYEDDKVTWFVSSSDDNIEYSALIDYIMEEFNNPTLIIKPDKTIILDFKLNLDY